MRKYFLLLILLAVSALTLSVAPATAVLQVSGITGLYQNATHGFSVLLPDGWVGQEMEGTLPLLAVRGTSPDAPVGGQISIFPSSHDGVARAWLDNHLAEYPEDTLRSEARLFEGADSAHQALTLARLEDGRGVIDLWTPIARGSQMFLIRVQTLEESWPAVEAQANAFTDSFTLETPKPFGVSRDDSLVQYWGEIVSIDPALARGSPADIVGAVFSGLVKLDTDLQIVSDVAETWSVSPDGTVFTFTLREDARFHDGRQVTAADFKYAWERALDPSTGSQTAATYLNDIVGADAMLEGSASTLAGVEALDARTLRVAIDAPRPYFLFKLAYPTAYVVDRSNVESGGEAWTDAPNGTGAFKLKAWEKDELVVLERNDDWYDGTPALAHVVYRIFSGNPMQMYENGEIDLVGLSTSNIDRARDPANPLNAHLRTGTDFCTSYIGFNVTQPPFDDPSVRRALALAMEVDREIEVTLMGLRERAAGFLPPGMPGHNETIDPIAFDPDAARRLLDESRYRGARNLPSITSYASSDATHWAWREHLGLEVEAVSIFEFSDRLDRMDNLELGVFRSGWCADYPDPQNFIDVLFRGGSAQNNFAYSNPAVDALLNTAAIERDADQRVRLYQEAERLILDDWVAVPLWHSREYMLVQPYVKGFEVTPIGVPQLQNISIERQP